jgi:ABC-type antimicrobial peptide transport system permease subunit
MVKELKAGNWFAQSVITYENHLANYEYTVGVTNQIRLNIAYAIFFMVNLCLGVIGTFWLQTRKRTEEAGIMRSFGATKGHIVRMLLGEGVILTIVSSLIGFFAYFQYAFSEGLYISPWSEEFMKYFQHDWIHDFGLHFTGVAGITLLILIIVVCIGIYIPARNISRVNPVDALRDE